MSDTEDGDGESRNAIVSRQADHDQQELFPATAFLEIERQRIDSYNRRTEVASQAVAAGNESDKRQFDYQMAKLESEDAASKRRDNIARLIIVSVGCCTAVALFLFLGMAFFGTAFQSTIALQILRTLGIGGGGFGVISGVISLVRRIMRHPVA